jgi:hypothetical protein
MYYTQIIRIPRRGISPSPPGGSRIPPGGIRGVQYMYPRPRAFFEGGIWHPPRKIKHPPVFRGFSPSLECANGIGGWVPFVALKGRDFLVICAEVSGCRAGVSAPEWVRVERRGAPRVERKRLKAVCLLRSTRGDPQPIPAGGEQIGSGESQATQPEVTIRLERADRPERPYWWIPGKSQSWRSI